MTNLNKLFNDARQKNLKEDFEIGQAAQALYTIIRDTEAFLAYLKGDFTKKFKEIHSGGHNSAEAAYELANELTLQAKELEGVAKEVEYYLGVYQDNQDPERGGKDDHRTRWSRWEDRTPRHISKAEDKAEARGEW